jgi:hypothetical protein
MLDPSSQMEAATVKMTAPAAIATLERRRPERFTVVMKHVVARPRALDPSARAEVPGHPNAVHLDVPWGDRATFDREEVEALIAEERFRQDRRFKVELREVGGQLLQYPSLREVEREPVRLSVAVSEPDKRKPRKPLGFRGSFSARSRGLESASGGSGSHRSSRVE